MRLEIGFIGGRFRGIVAMRSCRSMSTSSSLTRRSLHVALRLAPVSEETARAMIAKTRAAALPSGWRGRPPDGAERAGARRSEFVADFGDEIAEAEINPLAVLERSVTALDCAIVLRVPPE